MVKKYYMIETEINEEKYGNVPQIQPLKANNGFSREDFLDNLSNEVSDYYDSYCFELLERAIPSDILDCTTVDTNKGLFVNNKVVELLSKFEIPFSQFFPVKVYEGNNLLQYYFMHLLPPPIECFDFRLSSFLTWSFDKGVIGDININSYEEFREEAIRLMKNAIMISYKGVHFTDKFNKNTAMFRLKPDPANIYINESLKDKMIEERVSGLQITNTKIRFNE